MRTDAIADSASKNIRRITDGGQDNQAHFDELEIPVVAEIVVGTRDYLLTLQPC